MNGRQKPHDLKLCDSNKLYQTFLASRKAGRSSGESESMLAQWEVPLIKMATSVAVWFARTLNACQGSIDPATENGTKTIVLII